MILKLTVHAQIRLQERGIGTDALKKVIAAADSSKSAGEGLIRSTKELETGKTLTVVYKKDGFRDRANHYIIITAYFEGNKN